MIAYLYEMVRNLKEKNRWYWSYVYKINKLLLNLLYPFSQRGKKEFGLDESSKIIVSLTTFPARIENVWITIASLLNQTMKPRKIILWLAEEQFQDKQLPKSLIRMQKRGLEIRYCDDLKPHKKYYYTMQEYPDYYVITADDDIFYPENHIENLWSGHERYTKAVVCNWSHQILFGGDGTFGKYDEWPDEHETVPSYGILAVGCNGVLYPPGALSAKVFSKEEIIKYALMTDDLWLKCMSVLAGYKTVNCSETSLIYYNILGAKKSGLWKKNTGENSNNDKVWSQLMDLYPEVKERILNR